MKSCARWRGVREKVGSLYLRSCVAPTCTIWPDALTVGALPLFVEILTPPRTTGFSMPSTVWTVPRSGNVAWVSTETSTYLADGAAVSPHESTTAASL